MKVVLPSPDEITAIRQGNRNLINHYYLANYDYIKHLAKVYCIRSHFRDCEDLAQETYLHFNKISFDSPAFFGHDIFKIFAIYRWGGARKYDQLKDSKCGEEIYVLDKPIKGAYKEVGTIGEAIESDFDIYEEIEPRPDISESLYNFLNGMLGNSPERKKVFYQFYWTGKTYNEIARELNKTYRTIKRTREDAFNIFRKNSEVIKQWLYNIGYYDKAA